MLRNCSRRFIQKQNLHVNLDESSRPDASYGASHNEGFRVGGGRTHDRARFKYQQGTDEDPLDIEVGIDLSKGWLQCHEGEQIGAAIPADILQTVEFRSDLGNGRGWTMFSVRKLYHLRF